MATDVARLWLEAFVLAAYYWVLLACCGLGAALWLLPRERWRHVAVFAPILGGLLLAYVSALVSFHGLALGSAAAPLLALCAILSGALAWRALRVLDASERAQQLGASLLETLLGLVALALGLLVPSWMASAGGVRSSADFWGSGDLFAYAIVADYLREFPGNIGAYLQQEVFHERYLQDHLDHWARLGSMALLTVLAQVTPAGAQAVTLPLVGLGSTLLILLARPLLGSSRPGAQWVAVAAVHPFASFAAYFSYLGQALSTPLVLGLVMLLGDFGAEQGLRRSAVVGAGALLALLTGSALILYPTSVPFLAIGALVWSAVRLHERNFAGIVRLACVALGGLAAASFYLPRVADELLHAAGSNARYGWDWTGPIGFSEVWGLQPVAGEHYLPRVPLTERWPLECLLGVLLAVGVATALRDRRGREFGAIVTLTCAALAGLAINGILEQRPTATHGLVKVASLTAPLLCLLALGGIEGLLTKYVSNRIARVATQVLLCSTCAVTSLFSALQYEPRALWYGRGAGDVARAAGAQRDVGVVFLPGSEWQQTVQGSVLLHDDRRLVPFRRESITAAYNAGRHLQFLSYDGDGHSAREVARSGSYWLGAPPARLFDDSRAAAGALPPLFKHRNGSDAWNPDGRIALPSDRGGCTSFVMSRPRRALAFTTSWTGPPAMGGLSVHVLGHRTSTLVAGAEQASFVALVEPTEATQPDLDYCLVALCFQPRGAPPAQPSWLRFEHLAWSSSP